MVHFNRSLRDTQVNAVCCDQLKGSRTLVGRLNAAGHRRFGVIAGPEDSVVGKERPQGAVERLAELGILDVPVVRANAPTTTA